MCSSATGHDIAVSKEVQDVLSLQTPVQAKPRLVSRTAPSASGAKVSITFDEAAPKNRLPDERFSRSARRCGPCATARATCIR